jgi:uncharacterized membrane protein YeaQ/YmgE (transglycosylase-associated protein family)
MDIMTILAWIVFGLIVGAIAKLLMPGNDPGGFIVTMLIGIVGSFIGGAISYLVFGATSPYAPAGWIMSILGAIVLLFLYRMAMGRRGAV